MGLGALCCFGRDLIDVALLVHGKRTQTTVGGSRSQPEGSSRDFPGHSQERQLS
jgi:hypothetical protein